MGAIRPFLDLVTVMDHQAAIGHADRLIRGKRKGEEGSAISSRVKCAHVPDISNNPPVGLRCGVNVGPSGVETAHIGLEGRWIGEKFLDSGAVGGVVEKAGFQ